MGVLTEYLKSEVDQIRADATRREEWLKEWTAALGRLYDRLESWLREADGGFGVLTTSRRSMVTEVSEPRLGTYTTEIMRVSLGGPFSNRKVTIEPRARYVIATIRPPGEEPRRADGMVEIKSGASADYYLFRLAGPTPDEDRWFIRNVDQWNADTESGKVEPLDRERFEAAILRVLR